MKTEKIPFNMKFNMGENLREYAEDPLQMKKGVEFLQQKMVENDVLEVEKASLASQIGVYLRILGDLEKSQEMFHLAISSFKELGKVAHLLQAEIRLGITLQWMENFSKSEELFRKVLKKIDESDDENIVRLKGFTLQHYGKQKFEQGRFKTAIDLLTEALELRLMKGEIGLIDSTKYAISIVRKNYEGDEE